MKYHVEAAAPVDKSTGLIGDEIIRLSGFKSSKLYPETLWLFTYEDYATSVVFTFMTNDFNLPALSIAEL